MAIEWNKLGLNIRNSENLNIFQKSLLKPLYFQETLMHPFESSVFDGRYPSGVKLLTRLRLGLSH